MQPTRTICLRRGDGAPRLPGLGVAVSLALTGSLGAHQLSYRLAAPDAGQRAQLLRASGHAYLQHAPALLSVLASVLIASLIAVAVRGAREGSRSPGLRASPSAAIPLMTFVVQEQLERLCAGGGPPLLDKTFLVGLLLQVPAALATWALARLLLREVPKLGERLRGRLHRQGPRRTSTRASMPRAPLCLQARRGPQFGGTGAGRAPPTQRFTQIDHA